MTLCLLLLFSMLVTLSAGALYYVSRTASEAYLYQQGLSSVYAAESGANVALGRLKAGVMGNQSFTLSVNGQPGKCSERHHHLDQPAVYPSTTSRSPCITFCPAVTAILVTVPSNSAGTWFSIFIDSSVSNRSPRFTA